MNETRRISKTIWGITLSCGAISAFLLSGCDSLPVASSIFATVTSTAMITFTPTSTPTNTATLAPTAIPTATPTPPSTPTATPDQRVLNPANQHLYLYVRMLKTWHEARDYCIQEGGHLVTIQGPWENKFVYELDQLAFDNGKHYAHNSKEFWLNIWLGATDEVKNGTWVWVTGEPWTYWNWKNNDYATAHFLTFYNWGKTWWARSDGDAYFVCEWESISP